MKYEVSYFENNTWKTVAQFVDYDMACEFANQFCNTICVSSLETGEILWMSE